MQEGKILQSNLYENRNCGHTELDYHSVTLCTCVLQKDNNFTFLLPFSEVEDERKHYCLFSPNKVLIHPEHIDTHYKCIFLLGSKNLCPYKKTLH